MITTEEMKQEDTLVNLILNLKPKPLSITQLADKVKINRSTLRYYLGLLLQRNWVTVKREKEKSGRPVMIYVNKKQFEKECKEHEKRVKEIISKYQNSPYTKKILEVLSNGKKISLKDILERTKEIDPHGVYITRTIMNLRFAVDSSGLVNEFYELSESGRKQLNESKVS